MTTANTPAVPRTHHAVVVSATGGPEVLQWTETEVPLSLIHISEPTRPY